MQWSLSLAAPLDVAAARIAIFQALVVGRDGTSPKLRIAADSSDAQLSIRADLAWLGLPAAGEPILPTARIGLYRQRVQQLVDAARVTTAGRITRLAVPPGQTVIDDAIRGPVAFENSALGEIVIVDENDGIDAAFVAAVDDVLLETPLVVRDDRQLEETARGLLILGALDLAPPRYAHVGSLLPDTPHEELPTVSALRRTGFLPSVVVSHLVQLGWSPGSGRELFGWPELLTEFSVERVGRSQAHFNAPRLRALNARELRTLAPDRLAELVAAAMQRAGLLEDPIPDAAQRWIATFLGAYGTQFATLGEALALVADLRAEAVVVPALELEKLRNRQVVFFLDAVGQYVDAQPELRDLPLEHDVPVIAQEFGIAHDDAFAALRMALTGTRDGAPLALLFPLLGHDRILIRIGAISSHLLHGRGLEPIKFGPGGVAFQTIVPQRPPEH